MKTQSAKAKGRRLQQEVVKQILSEFHGILVQDDVRSTSMGAQGADIQLSPQASRLLLNPDIECKNTEKLAIWNAIKQVEDRLSDGKYPLVIFKRNNSDVYATLPLSQLLVILREASAYVY